MTKTLTGRVYLKGRLFGCKMIGDKLLDDWLDEFAKKVIEPKIVE